MQATSRVTDPDTSRQAASNLERTGQRQRQLDQCLDAVRRFSGHTAPEIGKLSGVDRYVLSRRLPDLRREGSVASGRSRKCNVTGNLSMTWYPAEECFRPGITSEAWLAEWHERHGFFNPTNVIPDRRAK